MTIGNSFDAALAGLGMLPKIGEGADRIVYKSGDVVYKVEKDSYWYGNETEAMVIDHFKTLELPDWIGIPDYTLFDNVLAMPYISGELTGDTFMPTSKVEYLFSIGYYDQCIGNIIISNGRYWLIDFAIDIG